MKGIVGAGILGTGLWTIVAAFVVDSVALAILGSALAMYGTCVLMRPDYEERDDD